MRRNYFVGGIVSGIVGKAIGAVAGSAISSIFGGDSNGSGTGSGGSTKVAAANFLEQSSREAQRQFIEGQERRDQENPVKNLIANLINAYENEGEGKGNKREDLNKYWNA